MQPDLPWNVAGIPPEAREAARAAARREGLSVGEWLTRRILRSLQDLGIHGSDTPTRDVWQQPAAPAYREQPVQPAAAMRDTDAMLASVSRSESDTQSAYKRIEDQLRNVSRRLEATERAQSDNSRAMGKAATEINIATREQAQAFDQLGTHVVTLADRLGRVEQQAANEPVKDAVRGLHQGLARLAEQISQTANQSAGQIEALAGNVESVVGKLGAAEQTSRALEDRIAAIADRVAAIERAAQSSATTIERALDSVEHTQSASATASLEIQRQAASLAQVNDALERLTARVSQGETQNAASLAKLGESITQTASYNTQTANAIARLEDSITHAANNDIQTAGAIARLEDNLLRATNNNTQTADAIARLEDSIAQATAKPQDTSIDRRLLGIEHGLADIAGRLDTAERSASSTNFEESVRSLAQRVDAADKRHREALAELRAAVKDANGRLEGFETQAQTAAPVAQPFVAAQPLTTSQPVSVAPPKPTMDMPPFPEIVPPVPAQSALQQPGHETVMPIPPLETRANETHTSEPSQPFGANHSFGVDSFAAVAAQQAEASTNESFLAAARRSAREAAASTEPAGAPSMFAWATQRSAVSTDSEQTNVTRYALIIGLALLVVVAAVAGKMLSGFFGHHTIVVPPKTISLAHPSAPALKSPPAASDNLPTLQAPATKPPAATNGVALQPMSQTPALPKPMGATYPIIPAQPPAQTTPPSQPQTKPQTPVERLTTLAKSGNETAEAILGFDYLDGGNNMPVNEAEAARWLERAANQGNAVAAYRLGTLYERGHGVPTDSAKALQWYTVAAKQGNRKAMHNLAVAFAQGTGVPKNMTFAVQWFTRAANLGLSDSQFNLAVLYERGMGVPQSLTEAYKWYAIAAAHGDAESKTRVDALATQLRPADKQAAQHAAETFQPKPPDKAANNPPTSADILGN